MGLALFLVGLFLLIGGVVVVWQGDWRPMWGAQAYMTLFVAGCLSVDSWYHLVGMSRGDGFALIGIMMFGVFAAGCSLVMLTIAGITHYIRGKRVAVVHYEGKSGAE